MPAFALPADVLGPDPELPGTRLWLRADGGLGDVTARPVLLAARTAPVAPRKVPPLRPAPAAPSRFVRVSAPRERVPAL